MIGIVDYGAGNLRNVQAALDRLGLPWAPVAAPRDLDRVERLILPGVGRFGAAMSRLRASGLVAPLRDFARAGRPLLGICLGMQLLFEGSAEDPEVEGLALIPGRVTRLLAERTPHIGWAPVEPRGPRTSALFHGLPERFYAYFAHSYAAPPEAHGAQALTTCPPTFVSAVRSGETWGVQFHPEKSGALGLLIVANFAGAAAEPFRGGASPASRGPGPTRARARRVGASRNEGLRARRVIPCLDIKGGRVVKGVRFRDLRDAGDPVERARAYDRDGADEVCLLDVSASQEERRPLLALVERVADQLSVPFSVGGGIRDLEEMRRLLLAGADRVSIGTAAIDDPGLISRAAEAFGSQFVIVSIDALRRGAGWEVTSHGGRERRGVDVLDWARRVERLGAGEILLNAIDADGTRGGYDIPLTRSVARAVRLPVIASGGAGGARDLARVLLEGEADAALAASIFHDGDVSIRGVKEALREEGVAVRL
ncbi:MAG TPA: imidazole glycerol phosphate synthase subunit HisF [Candidatus Polarisedimenticolia bacterium]|nr:imidazole glycerol phosphate synthase subunit HisF [Candidatus Polarisedimenticolia bacterium]